jgi:hypothetical protein
MLAGREANTPPAGASHLQQALEGNRNKEIVKTSRSQRPTAISRRTKESDVRNAALHWDIAADGDARFANRCAASGLASESEAYRECLRLQQEMGRERIRQGRGSQHRQRKF